MTLRAIRVEIGTVMGGAYTLLPGNTIEEFEALGLGDSPFTYHHERVRFGHCWGCDRPIWEGQPFEMDEDYDRFHVACRWEREADRELEANLYKPRYVVAVYECDREMGGPEEEGWSYETGRLVTHVEVNDLDAANLIREGLSLEYPYTGKRGYYSKREPDFSVVLMDRHEQAEDEDSFDARMEPVSYYPTHTPYYC